MQLQAILTIITLTVSAAATAIPAAVPDPEAIAVPADTLEARVTQLRWNARKDDGSECSTKWGGVCYEDCVTEGTDPSRKCIRSSIASAIDGAGCSWLKSKCKCVCNRN
ncbi:hypothetical protein BU25DRAFT_449339 [Macroventuria anomochaeta]|uniref:Uncharacterized protein n=1 Tax=Macroventuria anomochaeta TaxID=301207 RepID=A0ACB6RXD2_9PLEO|nr:uncharacterized protein BU25DRAFT_449339 [Macroventuria anomochaeta]KAF2626372.1 hypothetical protein BU25DRAFT_449339 [Macroventuria anomochaeta]